MLNLSLVDKINFAISQKIRYPYIRMTTPWKVIFSKKAAKQLAKLPESIRFSMLALANDMMNSGPIQYKWPNYSKLKGAAGKHHCHIKKGRPTYVACWVEVQGMIQVLEVYYVGTHENAPYS
jgi:mRNA-degrading endonuclease RelE of RelBE toxin-antitoxin system